MAARTLRQQRRHGGQDSLQQRGAVIAAIDAAHRRPSIQGRQGGVLFRRGIMEPFSPPIMPGTTLPSPIAGPLFLLEVQGANVGTETSQLLAAILLRAPPSWPTPPAKGGPQEKRHGRGP